jgi:serine/threonine protein kinase
MDAYSALLLGYSNPLMQSFPNWSQQGYEVIRVLGRNRWGGRVTYVAKALQTQKKVAIKQFQFADDGSKWSGHKAHEREIAVLQNLHYPGIPRYLGAFETARGFCIVQDYIEAPDLGRVRNLSPDNAKNIAIQALQILQYVHGQNVIHKDIKPENLLLDQEGKVYLVDFGLAHEGEGSLQGSSMFGGTPVFMPPEQLRGEIHPASDLYSLGVTLLCLLTGTPSAEAARFADPDSPVGLKFHHLLPFLNPRFLEWLENMVQPLLRERYRTAKEALEILLPLDTTRYPIVRLDVSEMHFTAHHLQEILEQEITIENVAPNTHLEGKWIVTRHPHDTQPWISVSVQAFKGNTMQSRIRVDTRNLIADAFYERRILLQTNAKYPIIPIEIKVKTAPLPIAKKRIPYDRLLLLILIGASLPLEVLIIRKIIVLVPGYLDTIWNFMH